MQSYYFTLSVEYDFCEQFYQPGVNSVVMTSDDGKRIQLPVRNLRPHVTRKGIQGRFRLIFDDNYKIKSFEKVTQD
ncbi:DUF2835 domain-containing protein [Paraglaciecola aquimarina]|uniref:DUF2835 domain-containing protein n=1 Tax=Paraglaciecola algarum TaxID=3050085 RepID=A0ABS9D2J1_9ALTE|nr:DUF2835 family protein [Paraglaciecola sp. G1-23]MCF2947142.1 DUF2835 domain-containing protein [Paraglaciecola sp. G1-23]